jgi:hypothetical protein
MLQTLTDTAGVGRQLMEAGDLGAHGVSQHLDRHLHLHVETTQPARSVRGAVSMQSNSMQ